MQKDTKQTNILPSNQRPNLSNQNSNLPSYNYDSHTYGTQTVPTKRLIENKVYTYGLVSRKEYIRRKQNKTQYTENLGGYRYPKSIISGGPKKFAKFVSKKTSEDLRPSRVYVSQSNEQSYVENQQITDNLDNYTNYRGGIVKLKRNNRYTSEEEQVKIILIQRWWRIIYQRILRMRGLTINEINRGTFERSVDINNKFLTTRTQQTNQSINSKFFMESGEDDSLNIGGRVPLNKQEIEYRRNNRFIVEQKKQFNANYNELNNSQKSLKRSQSSSDEENKISRNFEEYQQILRRQQQIRNQSQPYPSLYQYPYSYTYSSATNIYPVNYGYGFAYQSGNYQQDMGMYNDGSVRYPVNSVTNTEPDANTVNQGISQEKTFQQELLKTSEEFSSINSSNKKNDSANKKKEIIEKNKFEYKSSFG